MSGTGLRVRFDPFELDTPNGVLSKSGRKLKLQEQPFQVLVTLLERPGHIVSRDELRRRLWPSDTFVDFDHGLNTAINRLRECLGEVADRPRFIETVPRRGYRFIGQVDPIEPPADVATAARPPGPPARGSFRPPRHWRAAIAAIAAAAAVGVLGWMATRSFRPRGVAERQRIMLAVLPLEDLSGDPQSSYFGDGLTEDIITELGGLDPRRLGVIARTSVMSYKSNRKAIDQVGRELGVEYVLEGSVRRTADRVRVSAQLIQVHDQTHLWARSFDRDVHDVLALQSDVARAVATGVATNLSPPLSEPLRTVESVDPEALDLYLRGREAWNKRTEQDVRASIPLFEAAIRKRPGYARAYAGLADAYIVLSAWSLGAWPPAEGYSKARVAATKALEFDDRLVEAHASLASISAFYDWNAGEAEREFRRALELNPSYATAHHWYAEFLACVGRSDEMLVETAEARRLDPLALIMIRSMSARLAYAGRLAEAGAGLASFTRQHPEFVFARHSLAEVLQAEHRYADAVAEQEMAAKLSNRIPEELASLAQTYAVAGRSHDARMILAELEGRARHQYVPPYSVALVYAGLGDADRAFSLLDDAYQEHSSWLSHLRIDARLDPLRQDPRFHALENRIGLWSDSS
jgi:TolB-like protein/DNA-binding winged helix-turn-helix (wHTH) protein/Tfp pilus assembly protein PilF